MVEGSATAVLERTDAQIDVTSILELPEAKEASTNVVAKVKGMIGGLMKIVRNAAAAAMIAVGTMTGGGEAQAQKAPPPKEQKVDKEKLHKACADALAEVRKAGVLVSDYDPEQEGKDIQCVGIATPRGWTKVMLPLAFEVVLDGKTEARILIPLPLNIGDQRHGGSKFFADLDGKQIEIKQQQIITAESKKHPFKNQFAELRIPDVPAGAKLVIASYARMGMPQAGPYNPNLLFQKASGAQQFASSHGIKALPHWQDVSKDPRYKPHLDFLARQRDPGATLRYAFNQGCTLPYNINVQTSDPLKVDPRIGADCGGKAARVCALAPQYTRLIEAYDLSIPDYSGGEHSLIYSLAGGGGLLDPRSLDPRNPRARPYAGPQHSNVVIVNIGGSHDGIPDWGFVREDGGVNGGNIGCFPAARIKACKPFYIITNPAMLPQSLRDQHAKNMKAAAEQDALLDAQIAERKALYGVK